MDHFEQVPNDEGRLGIPRTFRSYRAGQQQNGRACCSGPYTSVSQLSEVVGDCYQVVVVDHLHNPVPVVIDRRRVHGPEDRTGDRGYGVTVSTDVRGQEDRFLRRLHERAESQSQRHDRQWLIRKAKRGDLWGSKCGQAPQSVMHGADRVRECWGGETAPPTLGFGCSTCGTLQNLVWRSLINRCRDRGGSGSRGRDCQWTAM